MKLLFTNIKQNLTPVIIGGVLLCLILFLNTEVKLFLIIGTLLALTIHWFSYRLPQAIIFLAVLSPFINWQIYLTPTLNAPPVDWLGLLILLAFIWKLLRDHKSRIKTALTSNLYFPSLAFFTLFLIIAGLAISQSFFWQEGLKYLSRFIILSYLVYLFLPLNIIKEHKHFVKLVSVYFFTSLAVALLSFLAYLYSFNLSQLPRIMPFSVGAFAPLGFNQNMLAELLIAALPLGGILLKLYSHDLKIKRLLWLSIIFMAGITVLTLSRAGWLTLILALVMFIGLFYLRSKNDFNLKMRQKKLYAKLALPLIFLILISTAMAIPFLKTKMVTSSNANRLMQWEAGIDALDHNSLFGTGPGSFMEVLNRDAIFIKEFGGNLEAHGWPLKILAETGWLGLIAFSVFLITFLLNKIKAFNGQANWTEKVIIACAFISALSIIFFELFNTSYFTAKMWLPLGILAVAVKIYGTKPTKEN